TTIDRPESIYDQSPDESVADFFDGILSSRWMAVTDCSILVALHLLTAAPLQAVIWLVPETDFFRALNHDVNLMTFIKLIFFNDQYRLAATEAQPVLALAKIRLNHHQGQNRYQ